MRWHQAEVVILMSGFKVSFFFKVVGTLVIGRHRNPKKTSSFAGCNCGPA